MKAIDKEEEGSGQDANLLFFFAIGLMIIIDTVIYRLLP